MNKSCYMCENNHKQYDTIYPTCRECSRFYDDKFKVISLSKYVQDQISLCKYLGDDNVCPFDIMTDCEGTATECLKCDIAIKSYDRMVSNEQT